MARRRPVPDARSRVSGSVAKRYVGCGILFPDLIQESNMGLIKDPRDCGNSVWSGQPDAGLAGPLEGLGRYCEQNISRACLEMALPENTGVEQTVQLILQAARRSFHVMLVCAMAPFRGECIPESWVAGFVCLMGVGFTPSQDTRNTRRLHRPSDEAPPSISIACLNAVGAHIHYRHKKY